MRLYLLVHNASNGKSDKSPFGQTVIAEDTSKRSLQIIRGDRKHLKIISVRRIAIGAKDA